MTDLYYLGDDKGQIRNPKDKQGLFTLDEALGFMRTFEPNGAFKLLPAKILKRKGNGKKAKKAGNNR